MLEGIGVWVITVVFLGGIIGGKFIHRPRIDIRIDDMGGGSSQLSPTQLRAHWRYFLILQNLTEHNAMEVEVLYRSNPLVDIKWPQRIKGLEIFTIENRFEKAVEKEGWRGINADLWGDDCPDELRTFKIVLRYRNKFRFKFSSSYTKSGGKYVMKHSAFKPRGIPKE